MDSLIKPKELRCIDNGRVFAYTEALAKRGDMVPVWPDQVDPNLGKRPTGLQLEQNVDGQVKSALKEKDDLITSQSSQLDQLAKDNMALNDEIAKLNKLVKNLMAPIEDMEPTKEPDIEASPEPANEAGSARMDAIVKATREMIEGNDPNNFTGGGKLRLDPLEAACGMNEITAAERDMAMEIAQK